MPYCESLEEYISCIASIMQTSESAWLRLRDGDENVEKVTVVSVFGTAITASTVPALQLDQSQCAVNCRLGLSGTLYL